MCYSRTIPGIHLYGKHISSECNFKICKHPSIVNVTVYTKMSSWTYRVIHYYYNHWLRVLVLSRRFCFPTTNNNNNNNQTLSLVLGWYTAIVKKRQRFLRNAETTRHAFGTYTMTVYDVSQKTAVYLIFLCTVFHTRLLIIKQDNVLCNMNAR